MRLVFDIEANGFYDVADTVWCIATKDVDTGETKHFTPDAITAGIKFLMQAKELIGHNIITYDIPLLAKLYDFDYNGVITDTLIMSRLFNPDRRKPYPQWNPNKQGGPHSLAAWGYRLGRYKPDHEEWHVYSQEMLHRCKEDVEINYLTYLKLLEEMKI